MAAVVVLVAVFVLFRPGGGKKVVSLGSTSPSAGASGSPSAHPSTASTSLAPIVGVSPTVASAPPTLTINGMVKGLPAPLARAQAIPDGNTMLVLGGLAGGSSTGAVQRFFPVSDTVAPAGNLAIPTHDAAVAAFGTNAMLFGGGEAVTIDQVQTFGPRGSQVIGHLPQARSDLVAATVAGRIFLMGGYDGKTDQPDVLMTTDGVSYRVVTQLPTPVRYAGVAVVGTTIYVIGGEHNGAQTAQIQAIDAAAGTARVVANLPVPLSQESAFVLGGTIFIAGGRSAGTVRNQVDVVDPTSGGLTRAGLLPRAAAVMALGQLGNDVYLFGGEGPAPMTSIVHIGAA